jgi:hypothetical protein
VSTLTGFLKQFALYQQGMSTSKRIRTAMKFIESRPTVVVSTVWVAFDKKNGRSVKRFMSQFPPRANGTHEPYIVTDDGQTIWAKAYVDRCWPLKMFPEYARMNLKNKFTQAEIETAYALVVQEQTS